MQPHHMILLYVTAPVASAQFYARILGKPAIEASPGFAMFELNAGTMLGLWLRPEVKPAAAASAGAAEIGFHLPAASDVENRHAQWAKDGVTILQTPVHMDFGFTFTASDPDGHRLRVFATPQ